MITAQDGGEVVSLTHRKPLTPGNTLGTPFCTGIDSRWCHRGFFPWYPRQNHVPWGRLSLWKWVPGISPELKAVGAFGW